MITLLGLISEANQKSQFKVFTEDVVVKIKKANVYVGLAHQRFACYPSVLK